MKRLTDACMEDECGVYHLQKRNILITVSNGTGQVLCRLQINVWSFGSATCCVPNSTPSAEETLVGGKDMILGNPRFSIDKLVFSS